MAGSGAPVTERASYEEAVWIPQYVLLVEREDLHDVVEAFRKLATQKITAIKPLATAAVLDPAKHSFQEYGLRKKV